MRHNDNLLDKKAERDYWIRIGQDMGWQQMSDFMTMALRNPEIMGKDIFSGERVLKVLKEINRLMNYYAPAYTADVEADYYQEIIDRHMREAFKEKAQPFSERYPYIKEITYKRARAGWA